MEYFTYSFFRMAMSGCQYLKRTEGRKKAVNPYCVREVYCEESLSCAANTTFWPQKTADILSYPQRERT